MQMHKRLWRVYLHSLEGELASAKERARSLAPYVGGWSADDEQFLFIMSIILELEGRHELALEFITRSMVSHEYIAALPSTTRMLERIKTQLTEEAYLAAEERGKNLDPADGIRIMKEEEYL